MLGNLTLYRTAAFEPAAPGVRVNFAAELAPLCAAAAAAAGLGAAGAAELRGHYLATQVGYDGVERIIFRVFSRPFGFFLVPWSRRRGA